MKKRVPLLLLLLVFALSACEKTFQYDTDEIPDDFIALDAPAARSGFQLHVPPFPVPSDFEREWFMRMAIGNTEDI